ncbi:hypothetical protein J6590_039828 [Homalodisca vitripennis]|nr:hypothetical protein J6590_039828 [Homalodisca vitripennis]
MHLIRLQHFTLERKDSASIFVTRCKSRDATFTYFSLLNIEGGKCLSSTRSQHQRSPFFVLKLNSEVEAEALPRFLISLSPPHPFAYRNPTTLAGPGILGLPRPSPPDENKKFTLRKKNKEI